MSQETDHKNPTPAQPDADGQPTGGRLRVFKTLWMKLDGFRVRAGDAAAGSTGLQSVQGSLSYLFLGMFSKDARTRITALIFWVSLILFGIVARTAFVRFAEIRHFQKYGMSAEQLEVKLQADIEAQAAYERRLQVIQTRLGDFNVELIPVPGATGILNIAEIDVRVVCDDRPTCDWIHAHITRARNALIGALTPLERDDLLSLDGKKQTKRRMIDYLNRWLEKEHPGGGQVTDVFFARLLVT